MSSRAAAESNIRKVLLAGRKETILSVPLYDWHWQLWYKLAEPVDLPQGTKLNAQRILIIRRTIPRTRIPPKR
jgi:hypothetical protein